MTVGAIIFWLDGTPILSALWLIAGIAIGTCTFRLIGPFATPAFEWIGRFTSNPERRHREIELFLNGKNQTEEFERLCANEAYTSLVTIGPLVCSCHGVFLGGIGGALSALDFPLSISASRGALYGALFGLVSFPFLAALIFAIVVPGDRAQSVSSQIWQRVSVLASPFLAFPIIWHCLKWKFKRFRGNTA